MTDLEIVQLGSRIRGEFITSAISVERTLDMYLAQYFTASSDKKYQLILLIFGNERITFSNKLEVLQYLCKEGKCDLAKEYPTILRDLKDIIETRNVLAHYINTLDVLPKTLPEGTIQFMKIKNQTSRVSFTEAGHIETLNKMNEVRTHIYNSTLEHND